MTAYALLILPSANRVYSDSAVELTQAELRAFDLAVLGGRVGEVRAEVVGGVPYVVFETAEELGGDELKALANLSAAYALFEQAGGLFKPVDLVRLDRFDDDL